MSSQKAPRWLRAASSQERHSGSRSEEHTSELQSRLHLVCRLLLEKKTGSMQTTTLRLTITFCSGRDLTNLLHVIVLSFPPHHFTSNVLHTLVVLIVILTRHCMIT